MKLRKRYKLVHGVGINDADYNVYEYGSALDGIRKCIWSCPFYTTWRSMLARCYSTKYQAMFPTYNGCSTVVAWHRFSTFRAWMERQDWEDNVLDKDILISNNKIYSPETCVFVSPQTNTFILENPKKRGDYPVGVFYHTRDQKYVAKCQAVNSNKRKHLGYYDTPEEAHAAWLTFKLEQAYILAEQQTDERVARALIHRYENYNYQAP